MNNIDLTKPNRQSPKGLAIIFVLSIRQFISKLWPILLIYIWKNDKLMAHQTETFLGLGILAILLIAHTILYFLHFKFHIEEENFILKKGYLRKQELNIPFERIQSVNYKANVLQRLLNVVSFEIDTAGSVKAELKIIALELDFAEALKNVLNNTSPAPLEEKDNIEAPMKSDQKESILKIKPGELIKIGLLQNHLKMGAIIVAFGWQFYNELSDAFQEEVNKLSGQVNEQILQSSLAVLLFMGIAFLLISIAASVIKVILRFFEFEFSKSPSAFHMQAGLLNRKNMIIPFRKIQEISWGTNPLKKAFSIFSIKIRQAASSENEKQKSVMEIPGCNKGNVVHLRNIVFGENEFITGKKHKISRKYFWRILLLMGAAPIVASLPLVYYSTLPYILPIVWFAISLWGSWLAIQKRYFQVSENHLIVSKGMFGQQWKQLKMYKIQVVDFRQSIFQKMTGLASLQIHTASGSTAIPFIDANLARELHTYLVYKIQMSKESWM
jgi:putative membrane protein